MEPKKEGKIPPKNGPKTSSTILQFTTIFINFFKLQDEVKRKQGARFARIREI
jgi:hypothetical protein